MALNVTIIEGNLTRDPEINYVGQNNTACCKFGIAHNKKYGDNETVHFFNVTCWGKIAENVSKYMTKGSKVYIEGELNYDTWQDKDGNNRNSVSINARTVHFGPKSGSQNNNNQNNNQNNNNQNNNQNNNNQNNNQGNENEGFPPGNDGAPF